MKRHQRLVSGQSQDRKDKAGTDVAPPFGLPSACPPRTLPPPLRCPAPVAMLVWGSSPTWKLACVQPQRPCAPGGLCLMAVPTPVVIGENEAAPTGTSAASGTITRVCCDDTGEAHRRHPPQAARAQLVLTQGRGHTGTHPPCLDAPGPSLPEGGQGLRRVTFSLEKQGTKLEGVPRGALGQPSMNEGISAMESHGCERHSKEKEADAAHSLGGGLGATLWGAPPASSLPESGIRPTHTVRETTCLLTCVSLFGLGIPRRPSQCR